MVNELSRKATPRLEAAALKAFTVLAATLLLDDDSDDKIRASVLKGLAPLVSSS
jgi:hypothetical protein